MSGLITTAVAHESAGPNGMKGATRMAMRYILLGAGLLAPYFFLLFVFATPVLHFLSKGDKPYDQYGYLLRLYVANYIVVYLMLVLGAWLAGLSRGRDLFYVQVVNVAGTVLLGLPLTMTMGVAGLCIGGLVSITLSAITAIYFIYKAVHQPAPASGNQSGGLSPQI